MSQQQTPKPYIVELNLTEEQRREFEEKAASRGKSASEFATSIAVNSTKKSGSLPLRDSVAASKEGSPEHESELDKKLTVIGSLTFPPRGLRTTTLRQLNLERDALLRNAVVMEELMNSPDRAAGIVGAAYVEDGLTELIEACWKAWPKCSKFQGDEQSLLKDLGVSDGAGSFRKKMLTAALMGLVGKIVFDDLEKVRGIRNQFAHWIPARSTGPAEKLTFESDGVRELCVSLDFARKTELEFPGPVYLRPTSARDTFLLTTICLGNSLGACASHIRSGMPIGKLADYDIRR